MYEREQKVPQEGFDVAFYTTLASRQKQQFSYNCQANTWWDPLFRSLVLCSFPNDSSALGKISGSELLNWTLADSSRSKVFQNVRGEYFFFCILSVFLFARFISFSLPETDPTKYAWLSPSPRPGPQELEPFILETVSNHSFLFQMLNQ